MSDADNNSAKLLFAPMKSIIAQTKMTSGRMSMTLSSDSQFMNSFDLTYALKCAKFDDLNCSTTFSLKFKLSGTYDQLLLLLQLTAEPNAQVAYNALANGDYGIYNGFGINQEERNLDLRALTYTKPANQVNMTIKLPNSQANISNLTLNFSNTSIDEANTSVMIAIGIVTFGGLIGIGLYTGAITIPTASTLSVPVTQFVQSIQNYLKSIAHVTLNMQPA